MLSRRSVLSALASAPAVLSGAATRSLSEVERLLARGEAKGKLSKSDLPTPALLLDLDGFEANIAKMANHARTKGKALRPHAKTHKCPEIAKRLMKAGAVGACAAKISEAEALAAEGLGGLLITSAVVGPQKIEAALRLARLRPETIFSVDNAAHVGQLQEAAAANRQTLQLAADLLVAGRTGITPGEPAVALIEAISRSPNLRFAGLQSYAGQASHTIGFAERTKVSREAMGKAVETRRLLEKKGIACPLVTGGSTGTYNIDSEIEGVTELQPGSFVFMDLDYNRIGGQEGVVYRDFQNSLTVLATVISKPADEFAIVDAGFKAFSTDRPFTPEARGIVNMPYAWAGDEHGKLDLHNASRAVNLGDRIEFVVPHCDPTVNLYDRIFACRGEQVEAAWRISARGRSW